MIYLAGIDTLVVGFYIREFLLTAEEWNDLVAAKDTAKASIFRSSGCLINFRGMDCSMRASGQNPYTYVLQHSDFTVKLAQRVMNGVFPEVYIEFRSQLLWRLSYREAYNFIKEWLSQWAEIKTNIVSRADQCVDCGGFPDIDRENIVSRVRKMRNYESPSTGEGQVNYLGKKITGWQFGASPLLLRIYNKSLEVKKSRKEWFYELWKRGGWDEKSDVTRIEFQLGRNFLHEFDVSTFESLEERLGDIFRYLTQDWFTLREPAEDTNKSRWPVTPFWAEVQGALPQFGKVWGQIRGKIRQGKGDHLIPQAVGLITSILASRDNFTLGDFCNELNGYLKKKKGMTLDDAVEEKRRRNSMFEDGYEPF